MPYQDEMKGIKLLQDKAKKISKDHAGISSDLEDIKKMLSVHTNSLSESDKAEIEQEKQKITSEMSKERALKSYSANEIYADAHATYKKNISLGDILTADELIESQNKYNLYIQDFNKRYSLDAWDYAIATSCGLFAAMLDIFFVKAPLKPTASFDAKVDGTFNQWVQTAFNKLIPPDLSEELCMGNTIGSADTSVVSGILSPYNHRLKSLSHDPILGFFFGIWDMMNGTCTVVHNGKIQILSTDKAPVIDRDIFRRIGRMFGHLLSDVNAPSAKGNRGMGLPAPFMGLLSMFNNIPVGDSNFGAQIQWMYLNGYDFRQFVTTSIPMAIMEVMLRVFYAVKQIKVYNAPFAETMLDTMPLNLNPRFRMILALAYGTSSAVNAGKVYITQNLLNANYASWMGLAWNTFHSLKWLLWDRNNKFWDSILDSEVAEIEKIVDKLDELEKRASHLPT